MLKDYALLLLKFHIIYQCDTTFIQCQGQNRCNNEILTCSENEDCIINCDGKFSCSLSNIICPQSNASCAVICNDDLSCSDSTIDARDSSSLRITSSGYESLSFSRIFCPNNLEINSCSVTHHGEGNGFNMMNLYTSDIYTVSNIEVECDATAQCWSYANNPILHYGNDSYSLRCAIRDIDDIFCAIVTTQTEADHHDTSHLSPDMYNVFAIGFIVGALLSLCGCLFICYRRKMCKKVTITQIPKRSLSKNKSMSLNNAAPELQRKISDDFTDLNLHKLEMNIANIDENNPISSESNHLPPEINVTVLRYSNELNANDESPKNIPFSAISDKFPFSATSSIMTGIHSAVETNGLAPDEFIIKSDTERAREFANEYINTEYI